MKKLLFLLVGMVLFLAACGDDSSNSDTSADTSTDKTEEASAEETEQEDSDTGEEANDEEEEQTDEVSDSYLDTGDYIYEIKEIEQMEGQFGDGTQIIAIELTFTNNSDEATSPWFSQGIGAEQETDTTVETLMGANGQFPEDYKPELVEMGDTDVKPGATVDAVIGYTLEYPGEPVRLYEFMLFDEEDISFERIVETTE
ncbi:DUF5067 domain-containing protein [Oceanobacillus jeddahense]|uniref:DUF5067 domain-containing protein n=1 Tax=Oceanobacillus jeddahense TaxID=1462527 RepID=UPI000596119F|nr:DUF5067 domain-containing protein [Oceanobacillus jeddahense]